MTAAQINQRLALVEQMLAKETDVKTLAMLNDTYQKLINKLVDLDLNETQTGVVRGKRR